MVVHDSKLIHLRSMQLSVSVTRSKGCNVISSVTGVIQIRSFTILLFALIIMLCDTCFRFLEETITFQFILTKFSTERQYMTVLLHSTSQASGPTVATFTPDYSDNIQRTEDQSLDSPLCPRAACDATGVDVREDLMLRILARSRAWRRLAPPLQGVGLQTSSTLARSDLQRPPQGLHSTKSLSLEVLLDKVWILR